MASPVRVSAVLVWRNLALLYVLNCVCSGPHNSGSGRIPCAAWGLEVPAPANANARGRGDGGREDLAARFGAGLEIWDGLHRSWDDGLGLPAAVASELLREWRLRITTGAGDPRPFVSITPVSRFALARLLEHTFALPDAAAVLTRVSDHRLGGKLTSLSALKHYVEDEATNLINVQNAYKLPAEKLVKGIFDHGSNLEVGPPPLWKLAPSDGLFLAVHTLNQSRDFLACDWLEVTWTLMCERQTSSHKELKGSFRLWFDLFAVLAEDYLDEEDNSFWRDKLAKTAKDDPCSPQLTGFFDEHLCKIKSKVTSEPQNWYAKLEDEYHRLCNDSVPDDMVVKSGKDSEKRKLKCHLDKRSHPYLTLNPSKVEALHHNPPVLFFHDALRNPVRLAIMNLSKEQGMNNSMVVGDDRPSELRTSVSATFNPDAHPVITSINAKSSVLTGLDWRSQEKFQVNNYAPGEHFHLHHDSYYTGMPEKDSDNPEGDRVATLIYYLSDVELGGRTVLPDLGLSVKPEAGGALFWYNIRRNGTADMRALHGGCPVLSGDKWSKAAGWRMK